MNTPVVKPTIMIPPVCKDCFLCALNLKTGRLQIDFDIATGNIVGKIIMKS